MDQLTWKKKKTKPRLTRKVKFASGQERKLIDMWTEEAEDAEEAQDAEEAEDDGDDNQLVTN